MKKLIILTFIICMNNLVFGQELDPKSLNITSMKSQDLSKSPQKVFINNFKIYYQMIAEAEKTVYGGRQLGGGTYTGDATARLAVGVEGVSPEDLQSLTDKLYGDYVKSLESMGLEVYSAHNAGAIPFYEDHVKLDGPRINQEQVEGSLMVVPSNFSYYVEKVTKSGKEKSGGLMGAVTRVNGATAQEFSTALYHKGLPKISKDLEDMIVVDIAVNVPSIYLDPKSKLGTAKIKGGPYLRVENGRATYAQGKGNKPGAAYPEAAFEVTLIKPLIINGVFESEEFKAVATKSRTTVPSYAAFFTVEDKTVALSNTIECDATVYQEKVGIAVKTFLDATLEKLNTGLSGDKVK
mgnify:CR=1 FL=1|tara:strand:+ start:1973 stop:3025 length:1053 start_codon:yes stop_codon:yes gene_type:complete